MDAVNAGVAMVRRRPSVTSVDMERLPKEFDALCEARETLSCGDFSLGRTIGKGRYARVRIATIAGEGGKQMPTCIKILKKRQVKEMEQLDHVLNERNTLASVRHPFIIHLLRTFQDERNLYMVLELVNGGELFTNLRDEKVFKLNKARFYIVEVIAAISYLHRLLIVYRDLKPENILIHYSGHLKLTDFGFAKYTKGEKTYTLCGTPSYMAPEIILQVGHGMPADWWATGILFYEMMAGQPPFLAATQEDIFRIILMGNAQIPPNFSKVARDFTSRCLLQDPERRLGSPDAVGGFAPQDHPLFKGVDWKAVESGKSAPPWIPQLQKKEWDTSLFGEFEDSDGEEEKLPTDGLDHENFHKWEVPQNIEDEATKLASTLLEQRRLRQEAQKAAKAKEQQEMLEQDAKDQEERRQKEARDKAEQDERERKAREAMQKKLSGQDKAAAGCCAVS